MAASAPRSWDVYVVPGAHFDLGWCASIGESLAYGVDLIRRAVDEITGPHPEYRFTIEYALFLRQFLTRYPEYRETVLRLLDEGRLEVCSTMTGAMEQILDGEATVRVVTEAQRWARRDLGRRLAVAQHSDLPGHTIQIPQILARSGVRYLAYSRFRPPQAVHWWVAPDGSRVLAAHHTGTYGWAFTLLRPEAAARVAAELDHLDASGAWPPGIAPVLMTGQSDLLLLEPEVSAAAQALEAETGGPLGGRARFRIATVGQFFAALDAAVAGAPALPAYTGEAPYGFYSLPAWEPDTYKWAREAEGRLAGAEVFSALRDLAGLGRYPQAELAPAWEGLFFPQDHNVGGRHGELNRASREARARWSATVGRETVEECLTAFATHVRYPDQEHGWSRDPAARRSGWTFSDVRTARGLPVLVANPLAWTRTDVVRLRMEFPTAPVGAVRVVDDAGAEAPSQLLAVEEAGRDRPALYNVRRSSAEILFVARDVPPCGYRTYYLEALAAPAGLAGIAEAAPVADDLALETTGYRLEIAGGRIGSLVERATGRDLIGSGVAGPAGTGTHRFGEVVVLEDLLVDLEDGPIEQARNVPGPAEVQPGSPPPNFTGRAWSTATQPARVVAVERGPVCVRVRLAGSVLDCPVSQEVVLYEHLPRVELGLSVDWNGRKNTLVRAAFPLAVPEASTTYETPYGSVVHGRDELPNTYRGEGTRFVQKWIDLTAGDASWGVTWSSNVCAHTLHADAAGAGTGLSPLLLRTAYSCGTPFLWYTLEGRHDFRFALAPHDGTWQESHSWRLGWEHHQPLAVQRLATARPLAPIPGRDTLPERLSLCALDGDFATVGTIFQPEPDTPAGTYAVRLVEVEGRGGRATLRFCRPVASAQRTDLLGDRLEASAPGAAEAPPAVAGAALSLDLRPYEIATLLVALQPGPF